MRLIIFSLYLFSFVYAQTTTTETEDESLVDLFQSVLDLEGSWKEQLRTDIDNARAAKDKWDAKVGQALNESMVKVDEKLQEQAEQWKEIKQKYEADKAAREEAKKQELKEIFDSLQQIGVALDKKKELDKQKEEEAWNAFKTQITDIFTKIQQQKEEEKQLEIQEAKAKWEALKAKFTEWKQNVTVAMEKKKEMQAQKKEQLKQDFADFKVAVQTELDRRAQAKADRKAELDAKMQQYKTDIESLKTSVDETGAELQQKFAIYSEQKEKLRDSVKAALEDSLKAGMGNYYSDKLQSAMDKQALEEVLSGRIVSMINPAIEPEPKTILDDMTNKNEWQIVTWLLLALVIILAVALVILLVSHMKTRNQYRRLEEEHAEPTERTPLARPLASRPPNVHADEKAVVPVGPPEVVLASPMNDPKAYSAEVV